MSDCIPALQRALGDAATPDDLEKLYTKIKTEVYEHAAELMRDGMLRDDALIQAARRLGDVKRVESFRAKRDAALSLEARTKRMAWVQTNFGNNFARGFESILMGIQSAKVGTRDSVMAAQDALRGEYVSGLQTDLRKAGVWDLFTKGDKEFDKDTFKAWYALGDPREAEMLKGLNPEAITTARHIAAWKEHARLDANDAGAWIGKLENWAGRQTHNAELIFKAGFDKWKADAESWFDLPRMMSERAAGNRGAMLEELYRTLASGVHTDTPNPHIGTGRNIGGSVSKSRTVHFENADAAWAYSQKYGGVYSPSLVYGGKGINTQSLANSVFQELGQLAQATGLMQKLGPNPAEMMRTLIGDAEKMLREQMIGPKAAEAKKYLDEQGKLGRKEKLDTFLQTLDGRANQVGNAQVARVTQTVMRLEQAIDLGGMLLSQFSDPVQHMAATNHRGKGWLSGLHESIVGLFTNFKDPENIRLAGALGVMIDNFLGEMARAGSFDIPGETSKMMQLFYKVNGANWWNSHMRFAAAAGLARDFAQDAGKAFDKLHPGEQRILGQYGIGAKEWDVVRNSSATEVKGQKYLTADNIADKQVAGQWRTLIADQSTFAQLEPDAKTRALMIGGLRPGTGAGTAARLIMQFKSFNVAFMQKTLGRELFGRGVEYDNNSRTNVWNAIKNGNNGERAALAKIMLLTSALGYASLVAKDLAKGIAPQDPSTLTGPQRTALALRAFQQGSGAGILGDFFVGQVNRMGGTALETAAGPVLGRTAAGINWLNKVRDESVKGDVSQSTKSAAARGLWSLVPGNNLWYARVATDQLFMNALQDHIDPGHLQRREAQMMRDSQQHFIKRP